ncbi:MAG: hypothetical protein H7289_07910, partial [Mucilaginibacter sp.]|nr:hypothetical protein [Mucilaginibacter sp.]
MATARSILKAYFLTGKKPTQGQFAALIDSFLHLSEDSLTITQIQGLQNVLAGKASTAQIDALASALAAIGGGGGGSFTTLAGNAYDNASLASALAGKQDKLNQLIAGCEITPGANTSIAPGNWRINGTTHVINTATS